MSEKIQGTEGVLVNQLKDLDSRGIKWFKYNEKKEKLIKEGADRKVVSLNIGGKLFKTTLLTILKNEDSLIFNIFMADNWDINEELFIDRGYKYFHLILNFMRNQEVYLSDYKDEEIKEILKEAKFYHLNKMVEYIDKYGFETYIISYEFSGSYRSGNQTAGTNNIDDLNNHEDRTQLKGFCTSYNGWIIFELNKEVEIKKLEIGGYKGNTNIYASSNGSGAQIKASVDKTNWTNIGTINGSYANEPYIHEVTHTKAKFIKFEHNSYIGIGYLRVIT